MEATNKAIPFITNVNGDFEVTEESKEFLRKLTGKKIGVICVVGKYRTGKSYFLNKVILDLQDSNSGFNVGPTINPCTKVKIFPDFWNFFDFFRGIFGYSGYDDIVVIH